MMIGGVLIDWLAGGILHGRAGGESRLGSVRVGGDRKWQPDARSSVRGIVGLHSAGRHHVVHPLLYRNTVLVLPLSTLEPIILGVDQTRCLFISVDEERVLSSSNPFGYLPTIASVILHSHRARSTGPFP